MCIIGFNPDLNHFYGENNMANYNNEEVFKMIDEVKNVSDKKVIVEKYKKIINITKGECAYISLYRNKNSMLIRQNVSGNFEPNVFKIFENIETWNVGEKDI